ncbi:MAG: nucleotidyltransferase domain-containing protein [Cellulosilyticaceae bacterium]
MKKTLFNKVIPGSYDVLKYVYPTMQEYVKILIDRAKQMPSIEGLVLFGSSVELTCGEESDLDIVVITEKEIDEDLCNSIIKEWRQGVGVSIDILVNTWNGLRQDSLTQVVYKEIIENGIVIYRR